MINGHISLAIVPHLQPIRTQVRGITMTRSINKMALNSKILFCYMFFNLTQTKRVLNHFETPTYLIHSSNPTDRLSQSSLNPDIPHISWKFPDSLLRLKKS